MDSAFLQTWHQAAVTSLGLFWTAFWAFGLGYLISSMIQVFVTRERMKKSMGEAGGKSVALGTGFGFISSSCSFAALATTRALFAKGAGLIPSLAFLLASTNLVIELGIIIAIFLGWQFVVGEYVGGVLLILLMWLVVRLTRPGGLIEEARRRAREASGEDEDQDVPDWKQLIRSREGWHKVAMRYVMEWGMVWKDVLVGFTVAGVIAAFVPKSFFQTLFVGAGTSDPAVWQVLVQCLIGPVAAFFTFIGSMGNIPLAAVLFSNGVSFAGIMAFIFSDLVVFPVLRIQAQYYGWRMAFYILGVFLVVLVATALLLHYGFAALGLLPDSGSAESVTDRQFFELNYTAALNLVFLAVSALFIFWQQRMGGHGGGESSMSDRILQALSAAAMLWLAGGLAAGLAAGA
ncbi:MAG: permease [Rhodospirillales bacterium]|nr:permease [Rhodospirillales bacterium]